MGSRTGTNRAGGKGSAAKVAAAPPSSVKAPPTKSQRSKSARATAVAAVAAPAASCGTSEADVSTSCADAGIGDGNTQPTAEPTADKLGGASSTAVASTSAVAARRREPPPLIVEARAEARALAARLAAWMDTSEFSGLMAAAPALGTTRPMLACRTAHAQNKTEHLWTEPLQLWIPPASLGALSRQPQLRVCVVDHDPFTGGTSPAEGGSARKGSKLRKAGRGGSSAPQSRVPPTPERGRGVPGGDVRAADGSAGQPEELARQERAAVKLQAVGRGRAARRAGASRAKLQPAPQDELLGEVVVAVGGPSGVVDRQLLTVCRADHADFPVSFRYELSRVRLHRSRLRRLHLRGLRATIVEVQSSVPASPPPPPLATPTELKKEVRPRTPKTKGEAKLAAARGGGGKKGSSGKGAAGKAAAKASTAEKEADKAAAEETAAQEAAKAEAKAERAEKAAEEREAIAGVVSREEARKRAKERREAKEEEEAARELAAMTLEEEEGSGEGLKRRTKRNGSNGGTRAGRAGSEAASDSDTEGAAGKADEAREAKRVARVEKQATRLKDALASTLSKVSDLFKLWDTDGNGCAAPRSGRTLCPGHGPV